MRTSHADGMGVRLDHLFATLADQFLEQASDVILGDLYGPVLGDRDDGWEDPTHQVGPAGADIFVCSVEESLDRHLDGFVSREVGLESLLQRRPGIFAPRTT